MRWAWPLALAGCGTPPCDDALAPEPGASGTEADFERYEPGGCDPDPHTFDTLVAPVIDRRCGSCHGETPAFGAPHTLTALPALLEGVPGTRLVDRIAVRAAMHTMPPPNSPPLDHAELDLLVEWATCGEVHPDPTIGLEVNREPHALDPARLAATGNLELPWFDVVGEDGFAVGRDTLDRYHCFAVDAPIDEPRHVRRLQVVLDDARVLHHVVLVHDRDRTTEGHDSFLCDDVSGFDASQLWAWAPGGGAFDFEEGGLLLEPGDRLVAQVHYNNGAGLEGVRDASGVRVFHGPVDGPAWRLADLGPPDFTLPPGESAVCDDIEVFAPTRMLAAMPHMHELGAELTAWVDRASGRHEDLLRLTGWNFEAQRIYRLDTDLRRGDVLHVRCGYRNTTGREVVSGEATSDEMCFLFAFLRSL